MMRGEAYFSNDQKYRYWLLREWNEALGLAAIIGLNPSTADEEKNDPTVRKGIGFSARWNLGGLLMLNFGAYRATDPKNWRTASDPFGAENSVADLKEYMKKFDVRLVVAAWGENARFFPIRCKVFSESFDELWCFGRNKSGLPRHPLMVPYATKLERFVYV